MAGQAGVAVVLLVALVAGWVAASGARRDADSATAAAESANERASELEDQLAVLRSDLQARQGEVADLEAQLADALDDAETAQQDALTAELAASESAEAAEASSEQAQTATSLANVTTVLAETDDAIMALHVTDVVDATTLVGFDLREMLADGPNAGQAIQVSLAGINSPAAGDCRHTQSISLATAWLAATNDDVLLRRPATAPRTDALGRTVAEVVAFANPSASLNVTLTVAGEALIDEAEADEDANLTERLRVAQQSAKATLLGVWGCAESDLRDGEPAPPTIPDPSASATPAEDDPTDG